MGRGVYQYPKHFSATPYSILCIQRIHGVRGQETQSRAQDKNQGEALVDDS